MDGFVTIANEAAAPRLRDQLMLGVKRLAAAGVDSPRLDAEVLLGHCLAMTREQLVGAGDLPLTLAAVRAFEWLLRRRSQRQPIAYIIGKQEFWSLDFLVTADVLIPRPETERLVEVALLCATQFSANKPLRIADLCTGSGAVAVSLATELPTAQFCATDISAAALQIGRANAELHYVAQRIEFVAGDLFEAQGLRRSSFDLIVSNPPYVRRADIGALAPEVSQWEPRAALDGGVDGCDFYRRIAAAAPDYLAEQGALALEIGAHMASDVCAICAETGRYREIQIFQDYAGRDRVVLARAGKS